METLEINKICNSREEEEELANKLLEEYIVMLFEKYPQVIGEPEIYGIKSITHFGRR